MFPQTDYGRVFDLIKTRNPKALERLLRRTLYVEHPTIADREFLAEIVQTVHNPTCRRALAIVRKWIVKNAPIGVTTQGVGVTTRKVGDMRMIGTRSIIGQLLIGLCYAEAIDFPVDCVAAEQIYRRAIKQSNTETFGLAKYFLAEHLLKHKDARSADPPRTKEEIASIVLRSAVDAVDCMPAAKVLLGVCYRDGCAPNYDAAFKLFSDAQKEGSVIASYHLAQCYQNGHGGSIDALTVFELLRHGERMGIDQSKLGIGTCYVRGSGCMADNQRAYRYYSDAMNDGLADGKYNVAMCCYNGIGCVRDQSLAVRLFLELATTGHGLANLKLARHYVERSRLVGDFNSENQALIEARKHYLIACDAGNDCLDAYPEFINLLKQHFSHSNWDLLFRLSGEYYARTKKNADSFRRYLHQAPNRTIRHIVRSHMWLDEKTLNVERLIRPLSESDPLSSDAQPDTPKLARRSSESNTFELKQHEKTTTERIDELCDDVMRLIESPDSPYVTGTIARIVSTPSYLHFCHVVRLLIVRAAHTYDEDELIVEEFAYAVRKIYDEVEWIERGNVGQFVDGTIVRHYQDTIDSIVRFASRPLHRSNELAQSIVRCVDEDALRRKRQSGRKITVPAPPEYKQPHDPIDPDRAFGIDSEITSVGFFGERLLKQAALAGSVMARVRLAEENSTDASDNGQAIRWLIDGVIGGMIGGSSLETTLAARATIGLVERETTIAVDDLIRLLETTLLITTDDGHQMTLRRLLGDCYLKQSLNYGVDPNPDAVGDPFKFLDYQRSRDEAFKNYCAVVANVPETSDGIQAIDCLARSFHDSYSLECYADKLCNVYRSACFDRLVGKASYYLAEVIQSARCHASYPEMIERYEAMVCGGESVAEIGMAAHGLAKCYIDGIGVSVDRMKAMNLLNQAIQHGVISARLDLARVCVAIDDMDRSLNLRQHAFERLIELYAETGDDKLLNEFKSVLREANDRLLLDIACIGSNVERVGRKIDVLTTLRQSDRVIGTNFVCRIVCTYL